MAFGSSALQAVGEHDHGRAAGKPGEAGHRQEGPEHVADARAAVPVRGERRCPFQRPVRVAQPEGAGDAREAGAQREALHALGRSVEGMGEAQGVLGVLLHRARDVDEQQYPAVLGPAPPPRKHRRIAALAHRETQRTAQSRCYRPGGRGHGESRGGGEDGRGPRARIDGRKHVTGVRDGNGVG